VSPDFSFILLTYNEEIHLPKTLASIKGLNASIFILDSGSTDQTITIAQSYGAVIKTNAFENHPKQWDFALRNFNVTSPWIIGLDADQVVSPELYKKLEQFKDSLLSKEINGIYLNRKNWFRGQWLRHGGYFPKYLLKMFRNGFGESDLNENMDHKFIVKGNTIIWKDGYLLEENLKENNINFWLQKHIRYSDLVAREEVERIRNLRVQKNRRSLFGAPDERIAFLKNIWWKLPLYWRPCLYFFYRFIIQLGMLDGKQGRLFHFLQGFWFRLMVDVKMEELLKADKEKNKIDKEKNKI
jgi:glycosyltransferase involved in cell wall biosynthesis